jgi:hypothetical protein
MAFWMRELAGGFSLVGLPNALNAVAIGDLVDADERKRQFQRLRR